MSRNTIVAIIVIILVILLGVWIANRRDYDDNGAASATPTSDVDSDFNGIDTSATGTVDINALKD